MKKNNVCCELWLQELGMYFRTITVWFFKTTCAHCFYCFFKPETNWLVCSPSSRSEVNVQRVLTEVIKILKLLAKVWCDITKTAVWIHPAGDSQFPILLLIRLHLCPWRRIACKWHVQYFSRIDINMLFLSLTITMNRCLLSE